MQQGKYKPIPYRWKELYSVFPFSNNLQIWLSVFAFSTFATSSLFTLLQGASTMMPQPNVVQSLVLLAIGSAFLISIFIALWSLVSLIIFAFRGFLGQKVDYDPNTTDPNVLKSITPIKERKVKNGKDKEVNETKNK